MKDICRSTHLISDTNDNRCQLSGRVWMLWESSQDERRIYLVNIGIGEYWHTLSQNEERVSLSRTLGLMSSKGLELRTALPDMRITFSAMAVFIQFLFS